MVERHHIAQVNMDGVMVGALSYDERSGYCAFEYAPQWLKTGFEISPVHMPLSEKIYQFRHLPFDTFKGLPAVFADSLPDDFGNALIDAWLARNGRDKSSFNTLERLLYMGSRTMGALEYSPAIDRGATQSVPIDLDQLIVMAQQVLDARANLKKNISGKDKTALTAILKVGTSAGGARPKAVVGINKSRTEIRSGQVSLPGGFEHFLLKFDGVTEQSTSQQTFGDPLGFGRMEYAYYLMAKDAGINMSYCELLEDGDRAHFMTKRFDRLGNIKIHCQSLCAMDHVDFKKPGQYAYEQLFSLMRKLRMSKDEALEMFRRMVFNIVARNQDDHSKNFGFMYDSQRNRWTLAPAYDIAYSYRPDSPWVNAHQLTLNGKRDDFNRNDFMGIAQKFKKEAQLIIEKTTDVVSQWPQYAARAGVFTEFKQEIAVHHRLKL